MFAPSDRSDRPEGLSDSARNVRETEEFVVNIVTEPFAEAMNQTSASLPPGESEFEHADLERAPSERIEPPRVAGIEVAFECKLYGFLDVGSNSLVLGEIVYGHVDDDVTTEGKLDVDELDAVGRLSGGGYVRLSDRFTMERPP